MNNKKSILEWHCCPETGQIVSCKLYGEELLEPQPPEAELLINGQPFALRLRGDQGDEEALRHDATMEGQRFVDFWAGAALSVRRTMGVRTNSAHPCLGVQYWIRRDAVDCTRLIHHGTGGPGVEAPLYVDTLSLLPWNWRFWGDETAMMFLSAHSNGPDDEWGHVGYDNDTPERVKAYMKSPWRRLYPGTMVIHGGLFYNTRTGHWLAITCRRPHLGYFLNIDNAGRGVCYDFTLHGEIRPDDFLRMPEIKVYFGQTRAEMMAWLGDYATHYYEEPPEWVFRTNFTRGLTWDNEPTWEQQGDRWLQMVDQEVVSGVSYCLVTNRPVHSGTLPTGYEPDPNHGTKEQFKAMCRRMADRGVPVLIWLSHSGLVPGSPEIDEDWFVRGIDGRIVASWGNRDSGMYHVNPGHPGYIEYTKKWIRFYIHECGCKGIFFDCYGTSIPTDFSPREFMRYPGQTNVMVIRFMDAVYECVKECDPDAIVLGEGASLDGPVNIFSICANPVRSADGLGPRDFILTELNRHAPKRLVVDKAPALSPGSGFCRCVPGNGQDEYARFVTRLLKERGSRSAVIALPDDLSILDEFLFVPARPGMHEEEAPIAADGAQRHIALREPWNVTRRLVEQIDGRIVEAAEPGRFPRVGPGIYRMEA